MRIRPRAGTRCAGHRAPGPLHRCRWRSCCVRRKRFSRFDHDIVGRQLLLRRRQRPSRHFVLGPRTATPSIRGRERRPKRRGIGTGSPGDGDPTVDSLSGPELQRAFAYAGPTSDTLKKFVAQGRKTNAQLRGCPSKPEKTENTTIDGEPAIIDELHCGVFALSASTIHDGEVYVFFTYDQPGKEAEMRDSFRVLVSAVSFSA